MPDPTPAVTPHIPEGLGTKLGKVAIAIFALVAILASVLHGDHSSETLMAMGGAIASLVTLMGGRYAQAAALYLNVPSPVAARAVTGPLDDAQDDDDLEPADDVLPEALALPVTDPTTIPPDVGDGRAAPKTKGP